MHRQLGALPGQSKVPWVDIWFLTLAVYARERAYMKDMPAARLVVLSKRDTQLMHRAFDRVVDNGRVIRTMFQMIRSGQFLNCETIVNWGSSIVSLCSQEVGFVALHSNPVFGRTIM